MFEQPAAHGSIAPRLGTYEIIRPLARGGMAELFLARAVGPEGFEKLVVLKRILPRRAADPTHLRSFLDEAKLVAGFDHPHIAHVYDLGTFEGTYFFTMEHVHGPNVHALLRRCRRDGKMLPIEHAVLIARDVASALHYAHERRGPDGARLDVVHRDVSPSNIIVSYDGVPKLIDFGIAKAASSSLQTHAGALKGKISYMSPEQARGARLDRRSDVFSLGVVLWEMIACRRLHGGGNDLGLIEKIIKEPPRSVATERADCPPELARIVERALALDPADRFPTAQAMQLGLEELARVSRLSQSRIGLSEELQALFADEIRAEGEARQVSPAVTSARAATEGTSTLVAHHHLELVASENDEEGDDPIAPPPAPPLGVMYPVAEAGPVDDGEAAPDGDDPAEPAGDGEAAPEGGEATPEPDPGTAVIATEGAGGGRALRLAMAAGAGLAALILGIALWPSPISSMSDEEGPEELTPPTAPSPGRRPSAAAAPAAPDPGKPPATAAPLDAPPPTQVTAPAAATVTAPVPAGTPSEPATERVASEAAPEAAPTTSDAAPTTSDAAPTTSDAAPTTSDAARKPEPVRKAERTRRPRSTRARPKPTDPASAKPAAPKLDPKPEPEPKLEPKPGSEPKPDPDALLPPS